MYDVFLSASIPSKDRNPKYYDTADFVAIRDAVIAIATVVVPEYRLVWGGHPAITPLIRTVYEEILEMQHDGDLSDEEFKKEIKTHVLLYQSRFFEKYFPEDNGVFESVKLIAANKDRESSLSDMRDAMLKDKNYLAAFFIGGMEGVEEEFELFRKCNPSCPVFPVASTGAAAELIYDFLYEKSDTYTDETAEALKQDRAYISLFRKLLGMAERGRKCE